MISMHKLKLNTYTFSECVGIIFLFRYYESSSITQITNIETHRDISKIYVKKLKNISKLIKFILLHFMKFIFF